MARVLGALALASKGVGARAGTGAGHYGAGGRSTTIDGRVYNTDSNSLLVCHLFFKYESANLNGSNDSINVGNLATTRVPTTDTKRIQIGCSSNK